MPKVRWGISAEDVDDYDRSKQYTPYAGATPPNGVYMFLLKKFQRVAGTRDKHPQMRVGLELVPREGYDERKYTGYWLMDFIPVTDKTVFRYVPLLDTLGVSGREFANATLTDNDGAIQKIGKWINKGDTLIMAQVRDGEDAAGNPRKEIATYMAVPEGVEEDFAEDDEDDIDDDDVYDDEDDEEIEEYDDVDERDEF